MSRDVSYKPPGSTIVTVPLNPDLHKRLRIHAASEGCSIKSVVTQMIENRLAATPTPPTLSEDLRVALKEARELILELAHARGCEYEGTDEEIVGFIDSALARAQEQAS